MNLIILFAKLTLPLLCSLPLLAAPTPDFNTHFHFECTSAHGNDDPINGTKGRNCFFGLNKEDIKANCCVDKEFVYFKQKSEILNKEKNCGILMTEISKNTMDKEIKHADSEIWKFGSRHRYFTSEYCPILKKDQHCPKGFNEYFFKEDALNNSLYRFCYPKNPRVIKNDNSENDMNIPPSKPMKPNKTVTNKIVK